MKPTIIDLLNSSVERFAQNPFLWEKTTTEFVPTTYLETQQQAQHLAAGLIQLGIEMYDKVALLSEGRNAWIIGELGILHAGAVNVPLSIKLEESNDLIFRLIHSETKYIFVSGGQLKKIRAIIKSLPLIKKVIILDDQTEYEELEIPISKLIADGKQLLKTQPEAVQRRVEAIKPDDLANITYTSGTTADPKGIMLTHRNYTANVEQALTLMDISTSTRTLLILPLDHCFAHVAGFYSFMALGASVGTVQSGKTGMETLKNIPINIKELKPNILLSVPALAKSFKKNIEANIRAQGDMVNRLFNFALNLSYSYNKEGYNKGKGLQILKKPLIVLFDRILFKKVREAFGGNLDFFIGGGALLDIDLQRFYYAIGIPMFQGYGLSEATPIISSNGLKHHKLGSSGYLVKPLELKIYDSEGKQLPNYEKGEIVIKGENVMAGYFKNEKATAETIKDGWLHTGDMGYMDNDGFLYVVGRFKSLLISSDGEKYSPEGIEESIADNSRYIDQVVLYNNQNPYTTALIVPNKEALKRYVKEKKPQLSWDSNEAKELALNKLQKEINEYKKGGRLEGLFPERWLPSAVAVIGEPFSEQNGLVNSTMKIMRGKVEERYAARIEGLYSTGAKSIQTPENLEALK
ncbi:AMP-dependent synthetase and ligase [Paludibacter propionicigenes WB4]|uniref:AMP-dependent synthetase and ligase n=1 Tax=Paludibacter propionicigenes (strain DSM 17365 / JCM 13257 / WB4) TaxID=694427 RepID=E4T741_PALPW|nr:AMP-binding protein [Paludibacter propionicigenes]ADQ80535.1 AMP-dependent synthetase and ligase [Paludibacter propionicigenes WB4]